MAMYFADMAAKIIREHSAKVQKAFWEETTYGAMKVPVSRSSVEKMDAGRRRSKSGTISKTAK